LNKLDFTFLTTLDDNLEHSYSRKRFDFDPLTFSDLDLKVTQNLIDWSHDYTQPFHKISQ